MVIVTETEKFWGTETGRFDLIKKLYDKLSTKTRGQWKRFANELEKLDDEI